MIWLFDIYGGECKKHKIFHTIYFFFIIITRINQIILNELKVLNLINQNDI